ncbi:spore coat protein GerQ [Tepidibacillus marianensis]|uniref:spore coat protein GerQ n=1 Tax=Tepidibacillus marianensis TaxID=3131995 RepID=UPI003866CDEA
MFSASKYDQTYPQPMMPMQPMQPMYPYPDQSYGIQPQPMVPTPTTPERGIEVPGQLPVEQSYIENILRLNLGKVATIYMTFENNKEWNAKVFRGRLEAAGRDHIIISDPETGKRYLLLMVNLDYISFDEQLNYVPPTAPR